MGRSIGARIIDGRAAAAVSAQTAASAALLRERGVAPTLAVLVPTDDEGTARYVRSIGTSAAKLGVDCQVHRLSPPAGQADVAGALARLSLDPAVHGVICQTPLPDGVDLAVAGSAILVTKDVDGASPESLGRVAAGVPGAFPPATAAAVLEILRHEQVPLEGRRAVVVGRSNVVGKPVALLLLAVPGGVGPVTTAQLLRHTIRAALSASGVDEPDTGGARPDRGSAS
jgi:methylenetetrahydrofolate dehydrogenase (NADP+)/methenyltetrahydrofolate cyclohydrolase